MKSEFMDMISALADGEASPEQEAQLKEYMERDENCRRVYEAFVGISGVMPKDVVLPPRELKSGVMKKIGEASNTSRKKNPRRLWAYFATAACLALVIFGAARLGLFGSSADKAMSSNGESLARDKAAEHEDFDLSTGLSGEGTYSEFDASYDFLLPIDGEMGRSPVNTPPFPEQTGLLNYKFASNAQFMQSEMDRLLTAQVITLYEGEYVPDDPKYANALPLVPVFNEDEKKALFDLMTADTLLSYDEAIAKQLEVYCTILFLGVESENGQTREDLTVTVWIYDGMLYYKISSQPPILYLSDTFPIDFEEFIRNRLTMDN